MTLLSSMPDDQQIVSCTRSWVEAFVVGLNLCPFSKKELVNDRVRFVVTEADKEEDLLKALAQELDLLSTDNAIETTILIHPAVLQKFEDYNQFLSLTDALIAEMDFEGVFQVASFHPDYQFGGTQSEDAENYTNRSPYPILHILREESLELAIAHHSAIDQIPVRNIALMNEMGSERLKEMLGETGPSTS